MSCRFLPLVALTMVLGLASPANAEPREAVTASPPPASVDAAPQVIPGGTPPPPTIDLTTVPDNLWQRIRNGFGMPDLESPLVADRQAWYLNRPDMLQRMLARGRKYLHHIVDELERRGMPTELALLPMVESSFNPMAASPAQALGMWQFIPSTGKNYALEQNWWRDERRDVIASTSAALDYLHNIYEMHGDWHLALASYNWGEGAVARAIAKNRALGLPTDYANLTLPSETRYYVPKLQALKNIIAQPDLFGFRLDEVPNRPYFGTVALPGDMDVALAARLAEMPVEEFIALNPAYHRPLIKGNQDTQLVVPADKVEPFLKNLARHEAQAKPLANWRTHVLAKGEKLERVAARYGLGLAYLKQLNGIGAKSKMHAGLNLLVPGPGAQLPEQLAAHLPKLPVEPAKAKPGQSVKSAKGKSGKSVEPVKVKAKTGQSAKAVKSKPKTKPEASTRKPVKGKPR
jgi:membrane-bound lytic murein transglycosylase D